MLGRAPRTKETLPDFFLNMDPSKWDATVWYRVTRKPQKFCGLTGFQRDPQIWGVTTVLSSFCFFSAGIPYFFYNCLQNTKLMNIPHFGIKIDLKLLKTCHKNRLKIDEFYTHQVVSIQ